MFAATAAVWIAVLAAAPAFAQTDVLPSWNDGPARQAIVDFVTKVTAEGGPDFVPATERIATFDNDGCLWSEQPIYVQIVFILDRVKALAPQHPEWNEAEPFKSVLAGDLKGVAASGEKGLMELMAATHAGMTSEEFTAIVTDWIAEARHPKYGRAYNALVYQPMLEVIDYLKRNEFKVFIVSGGGIEFMRPWTEKVYGIPAENVVGSSIKTKYEVRDGVPVIVRLPEIDFIDDKAGKPIGIQKFIGKRPIAAFGNSDGGFEMLEWTTSGPGRRLGVIVHHDDAERETAYDRESHIGRLDKGLDEAPIRGWTVVSMKNDWKTVFPFGNK
ncbi:haloacid dehalogenase [Ensifer adhaerens]|uniref:Haloacid dehalogenase n=1 Tax=Ensifer adhaerens TaxID=106592 RepID=A0A0L8BCH0_ENSAD|nr:haloacid dehalogenase [Ensifer adhaerens]